MIEVANVRVSLDDGAPDNARGLARAVARALNVKTANVASASLLKRSVDARKKNDVHFIATILACLSNAADEDLLCAGKKKCARGVSVKHHEPHPPLAVPDLSASPCVKNSLGQTRPIVVGFGPAGMFCALYLARCGLRPIVLERGGNVDERMAAVESFNEGGELDVSTNIQFGEGGAGTFSDGKLTTGTKSPLIKYVLDWFVEAGAPGEILWEAKPHIGTDRLVDVVRATRREIERLGGEVRFHSQLVGLGINGGALNRVCVRDTSISAECCEHGTDSPGKDEWIDARVLALACGHSARDTFEMLESSGFFMEQKPFSMGVRIEHRQSDINRAQYGRFADHPALGAADYKMVVHLPSGRSAYTFCMCPGGRVVCAASEEDSVVVNGMSVFARDGENSNAALLVSVTPDDFDGDDPLAGVALQRKVEHDAFECAIAAGGVRYQAPAQTVGDFLSNRSGSPSVAVNPSYSRGVAWADLRGCLPSFVADSIEEALPLLGRKLRGFDSPDAVMTGVETRSSSPVRVVRDDFFAAQFDDLDENGCRIAIRGVFPCGEGPGYAGGIMSAAVDGLRVAQAVASQLEGTFVPKAKEKR